MAFLDTIMWPFSWAVSFILSTFHTVLSMLGLPEASGWNWAISILLLVLVIRIILIPLFVRQIKSQRGMQIIQPEIQKLQAKYKGKKDPVSRQQMAAEQQSLFKKHKVNPFTGGGIDHVPATQRLWPQQQVPDIVRLNHPPMDPDEADEEQIPGLSG